MAHQADILPWEALASNLEYARATPELDETTNLYFRALPNQGKDLNNFINVFIQALKEQSVRERKKYPEKYDPPGPEDFLLNEAVVARLTPCRCPDRSWWPPFHTRAE